MPKAEHLEQRIQQINEGRYEVMLREIMAADRDELKRRYIEERQMEPDGADEMWEPEDKRYL